jgi:hypothetical protein
VEQFWIASAEGSGCQAVTWEVERGRRSVVAINVYGSRRMVLDATWPQRSVDSWASGSGLLGLLLVAGAVVLIVASARRSQGAPPGSSIHLAGPVVNEPGRRSGSTPRRDKRDEVTHY